MYAKNEVSTIENVRLSRVVSVKVLVSPAIAIEHYVTRSRPNTVTSLFYSKASGSKPLPNLWSAGSENEMDLKSIKFVADALVESSDYDRGLC